MVKSTSSQAATLRLAAAVVAVACLAGVALLATLRVDSLQAVRRIRRASFMGYPIFF